jgi:hypothetical protein
MLYYSCECGEEYWFGSDPPPKCAKCSKCGSGFGSDAYRPAPVPHEFTMKEVVETDEGDKTRTRCKYCYKTKAAIKKLENK